MDPGDKLQNGGTPDRRSCEAARYDVQGGETRGRIWRTTTAWPGKYVSRGIFGPTGPCTMSLAILSSIPLPDRWVPAQARKKRSRISVRLDAVSSGSCSSAAIPFPSPLPSAQPPAPDRASRSTSHDFARTNQTLRSRQPWKPGSRSTPGARRWSRGERSDQSAQATGSAATHDATADKT